MTGFTGGVITMAGLCEIALPTRTIRLCDGGLVNWPAVGVFSSADDFFGTIGSVEAFHESIGDESPAARMTMLPPSTAAAVDLALPSAQGSVIRMWMAELDPTTAAVLGTPELLFTGVLESLTLKIDRAQRSVDIDYASQAERLFSVSEGNVLSPRWHKAIWSGETGLDHATGIGVAVAWGVASPPRGSSYSPGGGMGGGGGGYGGRYDYRRMNLY